MEAHGIEELLITGIVTLLKIGVAPISRCWGIIKSGIYGWLLKLAACSNQVHEVESSKAYLVGVHVPVLVVLVMLVEFCLLGAVPTAFQVLCRTRRSKKALDAEQSLALKCKLF